MTPPREQKGRESLLAASTGCLFRLVLPAQALCSSKPNSAGARPAGAPPRGSSDHFWAGHRHGCCLCWVTPCFTDEPLPNKPASVHSCPPFLYIPIHSLTYYSSFLSHRLLSFAHRASAPRFLLPTFWFRFLPLRDTPRFVVAALFFLQRHLLPLAIFPLHSPPLFLRSVCTENRRPKRCL